MGIGLTTEAGGLASRPNHALTGVVTCFALAARDFAVPARKLASADGQIACGVNNLRRMADSLRSHVGLSRTSPLACERQ